MHALPLARSDDSIVPGREWDAQRPREAETYLRGLLAGLPRTADESVESANRSIELLAEISRTEILQGKVTGADGTLIQAEKAIQSDTKVGARLSVLLERGRMLVVARTPSMARERFFEAWALAKDLSAVHHQAIDAASMLSRIETPKQRFEWTVRGHDLSERSDNPRARAWRACLLVRIGDHYVELLQLSRAAEAFEKASAVFVEQGESVKAIVANSLLGRALRMMHRYEEALALQQGLLRALAREGLTDGIINEEVAECLQALRRVKEAESYFARAYELFSSDATLVDGDPVRLRRLKTLGKPKEPRN